MAQAKAYRITYCRPFLPLTIGIDRLPYCEVIEASCLEQVVEWANDEDLDLIEVQPLSGEM